MQVYSVFTELPSSFYPMFLYPFLYLCSFDLIFIIHAPPILEHEKPIEAGPPHHSSRTSSTSLAMPTQHCWRATLTSVVPTLSLGTSRHQIPVSYVPASILIPQSLRDTMKTQISGFIMVSFSVPYSLRIYILITCPSQIKCSGPGDTVSDLLLSIRGNFRQGTPKCSKYLSAYLFLYFQQK